MRPRAGKILSDQLVKLGVQRVFSVAGESFLAALEALRPCGIQNVVCRHRRRGPRMTARGAGQAEARPARRAALSRAAGACNASAGVHVRGRTATPMVLVRWPTRQMAKTDRENLSKS